MPNGEKKWFAWLGITTGVLYCVLVLFNLSGSSLMLNSEDAFGPGGDGAIVGVNRPIRSDEWLRASPQIIGSAQDWWEPKARPSLAQWPERDESVVGRTSHYLLFPEIVVSKLLGDRGFAFRWWLPVFAGFWSICLFFRSLGNRVGSSVASAIICVASPVVVWWSNLPLNSIWPPALLGATVLTLTQRRVKTELVPTRRVSIRKGFGAKIPLVVLAILLLSRSAFVYQIWTIPALLVVSAMVVDALRRKRMLRSSTFLIIGILVAGGLLVATRLFILQDAVRALSNTIYPGSRISTGGTHNVPLFSAPVSMVLASKVDPVVVGSNLSEIALGWNAVVIPAIVMLIRNFKSHLFTANPVRFGHFWTVASYVLLLVWSRIPFPPELAEILPLRIIPGDRAGQILSALLPIGALHYLTLENPSKRRRELSFEAFVSGLIGFVVTGMSLAGMRILVPDLGLAWVWGLALVVGFSLSGLVLAQRRELFLLPMILLAVSASATVNPLVHGLGPLVESSAAAVLRETVLNSENPSGRVATDDIFVDALVMASGLYQVNGQQEWGPSLSSYSILDPDSVFKDQWNRGASYVVFGWSSSPDDEVFISGQNDFVRITIYPCSREIFELEVKWIISLTPLDLDCLALEGSFFWQGLERSIYRVV